jgi:hypothetical protein
MSELQTIIKNYFKEKYQSEIKELFHLKKNETMLYKKIEEIYQTHFSNLSKVKLELIQLVDKNKEYIEYIENECKHPLKIKSRLHLEIQLLLKNKYILH